MIPRRPLLIALVLLLAGLLIFTLAFHLRVTQTRTLMGMPVTITVQAKTRARGMARLNRAFDKMARLEKIFSDRDPASELVAVNRQAGLGWVSVSPELAQALDRAFYWHAHSQGLFDITVGRLERAWGFKSADASPLPSRQNLQALVQQTGMQHIAWDPARRRIRFLQPGLLLDFGGLAKLEILLALRDDFQQQRVRHYLVNLGGDILAGSHGWSGSWSVGVADASQPNRLAARWMVRNRLVLTSGDYFRRREEAGRTYHHILDPRTGWPSTAARAATVVMPDNHPQPMPSIVLFLLGPEKGLALIEAQPGMEGLIQTEEKTVFSSGMRSWVKK